MNFMERATVGSTQPNNVRDLTEAACLQAAANDQRSDVHKRFDQATVYIELKGDNGPMVRHEEYRHDPGPWIFAYSRMEYLVPGQPWQEQDAADQPFWTHRRGRTLLDELDSDLGVILDPGMAHAVVITRPRIVRKGDR